MLVHHGCARERRREVSRQAGIGRKEVFFALIKKLLKEKPKGWFAEIAKSIKGVSEETTTGVHRLYTWRRRQAAVPAINVNDSVTKSKFDNSMAAANRWSTAFAAHRRDDVGKVAMVGLRRRRQGFGGLAAPGRLRVMVSEVDPICALQAAMEGYKS